MNQSNNSKKLKIAMIGQKRIPSREGGVEIVVEELSTRMVKLGHQVTCYNRKGHHVSGEEFDSQKLNEYKGVKIKSVLTINKKGLAAMTSSVFAAIHAALGNYDIVHFHAEGPCAMLWLPKICGKKCIATIHGIDWQREKWQNGIGSKYIKLGEKIAVKYADEIIVLSENVQKYFLDTYNRTTHFIPNGVSKPQIRDVNIINKQFGLKKDDYILFLGRIVPEKGVQYLIDAYNQLRTDKKLVIAGGSSDTDDFMDELKLKAKDNQNIIFTGFVQGKILDELYSNAYIYVLPSDLEGMPLSLLEAMSYGNCCLTSDIDECTEVVEDKSVVFKKSNVEDLKEKLQILCEDNRIVNAYKEETSEFICHKYNWDEVVKKTLVIYE
ncbi:MAG: glycosyltransferase family 4 protein [Erysipelotrichaceae bacterium]|nr:glycosyltransferase family 4 protein [Erysipelotrichaceae bacterium]